MGVILAHKLCYQLFESFQGDLEIRIIGNKKYVGVAQVNNDNKDKNDIIKIIKNWFDNKQFNQLEYREKALKGEIDPLTTWEKIKHQHHITDSYDIKRESAA